MLFFLNMGWVSSHRKFFHPLFHKYGHLSFGLFDQATEQPGLGIIVDVPWQAGPTFQVVDYWTFPRLGKARFPVAIRPSKIELHMQHPVGATSACWARCNTTSLWGVLTAGHAVSGNLPGRPVPMASGAGGALLRSFFQPVDAAFVLTAAPFAAPAPLSILSFPAMGMPVTVECQSGSVSRTIVEVTNNCGVLHTREMSILIYLDNPASPGDSGSLVRTSSGDAVGIYKGSMTVPASPSGQRGSLKILSKPFLYLMSFLTFEAITMADQPADTFEISIFVPDSAVMPTADPAVKNHSLRDLIPGRSRVAKVAAVDVQEQWNKTVDTLMNLSSTVAGRARDWSIEEIEVGLTLSAKGELLFIAEAGAEASIKFVLRRKAAAGT